MSPYHGGVQQWNRMLTFVKTVCRYSEILKLDLATPLDHTYWKGYDEGISLYILASELLVRKRNNTWLHLYLKPYCIPCMKYSLYDVFFMIFPHIHGLFLKIFVKICSDFWLSNYPCHWALFVFKALV